MATASEKQPRDTHWDFIRGSEEIKRGKPYGNIASIIAS